MIQAESLTALWHSLGLFSISFSHISRDISIVLNRQLTDFWLILKEVTELSNCWRDNKCLFSLVRRFLFLVSTSFAIILIPVTVSYWCIIIDKDVFSHIFFPRSASVALPSRRSNASSISPIWPLKVPSSSSTRQSVWVLLGFWKG